MSKKTGDTNKAKTSLPDKDFFKKIFESAVADKDFFEAYSTTHEMNNINNLIRQPDLWNTHRPYAISGISFAKDYLLFSVTKEGIDDQLIRLENLQTEIAASKEDYENLKTFSTQVSEATVLSVYAKNYSARADGYKSEAANWMNKMLWAIGVSLVMFAFIVFVNIAEVDFIKDNIAEDWKIPYIAFALKFGLVIAMSQVIKFIYKNYNAVKHLQVVNQHRADVLNSLQAVYTVMGDSTDKSEFIKTAALIAFQPYESGYITTKEGAGSGEQEIATLLMNILGKK